MRLLVCGGRDFTNREALNTHLNALLQERGRVSVLIHGDASGADTLAKEWAGDAGIPTLAFPAKWEKYGRSAGSIRNSEMLAEGKPDLVVAFPGGVGTNNMVFQARRARVPVILILGSVAKQDGEYLF